MWSFAMFLHPRRPPGDGCGVRLTPTPRFLKDNGEALKSHQDSIEAVDGDEGMDRSEIAEWKSHNYNNPRYLPMHTCTTRDPPSSEGADSPSRNTHQRHAQNAHTQTQAKRPPSSLTYALCAPLECFSTLNLSKTSRIPSPLPLPRSTSSTISPALLVNPLSTLLVYPKLPHFSI